MMAASYLTFLFLSILAQPGQEAQSGFREVDRFDTPEARQGVAVDREFFYAVGSREIGRYEKRTGRLLARWQGSERGPIIHLDSGVVVDGRLYAAHSNYPEVPMTSSVEIWDAETLRHIGNHSFGIMWGSCTWVDRYQDYWWAAFAHYDKLKEKSGTDNRWTTLVKFDDQWKMLEAWSFPPAVVERFDGMSNSGGSWGPDGFLYCTGHDRGELYVLKLPSAGSVLELVQIIPIANTGQGIAWDRSEPGKIYTIRKRDRQVVVFEFLKETQIDFQSIESPVIFKGDATTAFRDPAAILHEGIFHLFFTHITMDNRGKRYWVVASSKSRDLMHWTEPRAITPKDQNLNFASPGNIIRYHGEWVLCMQTYPTPNDEKYGNDSCRVWTTRSVDLEDWSSPELLRVKGPDVPVGEMGRLIDPYLVEDKDEPGKWWCFFDDNAANMSYSFDLKTWTYFNRVDAGENACVLVEDDEYLMFHSPKNGIGIKRSPDMKRWVDVEGLILLGQEDWPWAQGRLTAGFVLDLRNDPRVGKYLMFFHGSGPEDERTMFSTHASLGLAWSDDLRVWDWPGKAVQGDP